jgi:hypothetical protein
MIKSVIIVFMYGLKPNINFFKCFFIFKKKKILHDKHVVERENTSGKTVY